MIYWLLLIIAIVVICWIINITDKNKSKQEMEAFIAMNKTSTCDKHAFTADYESTPNISEISCVKCNRIFERISWFPDVPMEYKIEQTSGLLNTLEKR